MDEPETRLGVRERKRLRTRQAIVDAACDLFLERGYQGTTLTAIAERAEIAPRTFFSYFPTKESLLFPESEGRIELAVDTVLQSRTSTLGPVPALLLALETALSRSSDMTGRLAAVRTQLLREEPEVGMIGAQFQHRAAQEIARALEAAYPTLGAIDAAALAGAFVGAAGGAVSAAMLGAERASHDSLASTIQCAVARVLVARDAGHSAPSRGLPNSRDV